MKKNKSKISMNEETNVKTSIQEYKENVFAANFHRHLRGKPVKPPSGPGSMSQPLC